MTAPLLQLRQIEKTYVMGDNVLRVLDDVSLEIAEGDFVAIMGPSGSGKSTLMNLLGCLDVANHGQYIFKGRDISTMDDTELAIFRRHTLGFIFQQFNLLSSFSGEENVALPLLYSEGRIDTEKSHDLLKRVGLFERKDHLPREMSGGQQQRVAIARALINRPQLILADEPTGNLDSHSEKQVLEILRQLNDEGMTIVMVTHEEEIGQECNRIIRMRDGKVVSDERLRPLRPATLVGAASTKETKSTGLTITEHIRQGLRQLSSNKIKTFLSVLGVLIGVASVVTMLAIGNGAQKAIEAQLSSLGANTLMVRTGGMGPGSARSEAGAIALLYPNDADAIDAKFDEVLGTSPNVNGRAQVSWKNQNWNSQVSGVTASYAELKSYQPTEGRFFTDEEDSRRDRVAVIGATVVRELFGNKRALGEEIKINKIYFRVIGILPEKGATGWRDQDDIVMVPLQTGMRRLFGRTTVDSIDLQIREMADTSDLEERIGKFLIARHRIPPSQQEDAFQVRNMADIKEAISASSKTMTILLTVIAAVSLIVGGIGIMNIMLVAVTERTKEIGLRKAIGATGSDILMQFLIESVVVGLVGGVSGVIVGVVSSVILSQLAGWTTSISMMSIVVSFIFSVLIGLIFGVYPARNASKLHPIEALRQN